MTQLYDPDLTSGFSSAAKPSDAYVRRKSVWAGSYFYWTR